MERMTTPRRPVERLVDPRGADHRDRLGRRRRDLQPGHRARRDPVRPAALAARIAEIAAERPTASESQIGWQVVEEVSLEAAKLLEPAFDEHNGRNGRLSMQTDPRLAP